jgi:hypothetical protein
MKIALFSATVFFALATAAIAEPSALTDTQLGRVTAGSLPVFGGGSGFNGIGNTGFHNGTGNHGFFNGNYNGGSNNGNNNTGSFNGNFNGGGNR